MNDAKRDRAIVAMAKTGMTYAEIGGTFGVTRERIRQILKKSGITGSTTRAARAAAKQEARVADRERVLDWARHNPGLGVRDAEDALGLEDGRVCEALGSDVSRIFVRQRPTASVRYSDEVIVETLRDASIVQGDPMSKMAYDEYVEAFGGPSGVLVSKRFGTWKGACIAAGLGVSALPGNRNRRWGQGQLVDVLIDYFNSTSARGTFDDYNRWAHEEIGRPSAPTVRNRFGSWTAAKRAALAAGAAAIAA
ncbi:MAG: sigma factor-like helix-turn-helix DNA-binding protein [Aeromicrobium sp.]